VGAGVADDRVAGMVAAVKGMQGPYGLWPHPTRPQASRWLTFDLLRSLSRLGADTDWVTMEPRTPFRPYSARQRRY
jgi:hypothetical protein